MSTATNHTMNKLVRTIAIVAHQFWAGAFFSEKVT